MSEVRFTVLSSLFRQKCFFSPFYFPVVHLPIFCLFLHCVMPTLAQASLSGGHRFSGGRDESPFWYPPPYDVSTYVHDFASYFDTTRFSKLPQDGTALVVSYGSGVTGTAVGARRNHLKNWAVVVLPVHGLLVQKRTHLLSGVGKRMSIIVNFPVCPLMCAVGRRYRLL